MLQENRLLAPWIAETWLKILLMAFKLSVGASAAILRPTKIKILSDCSKFSSSSDSIIFAFFFAKLFLLAEIITYSNRSISSRTPISEAASQEGFIFLRKFFILETSLWLGKFTGLVPSKTSKKWHHLCNLCEIIFSIANKFVTFSV